MICTYKSAIQVTPHGVEDRIAAETSSDGGKSLASHDIHTSVTVSSIDPDDNASYELVGIDVDSLFGCCWVGPRLMIRRVPDETAPTDRRRQ